MCRATKHYHIKPTSCLITKSKGEDDQFWAVRHAKQAVVAVQEVCKYY